MKEQEEAESQVPVTSQAEEEKGGFDRRRFLGGVGGVTVGALAGGFTGLAALSDPSNPNGAEAVVYSPQGDVQRRNSAYQIRHQAAVTEKNEPLPAHVGNGDDELYANRLGSFSKTFPHDSVTAEVDPAAYNTYLSVLASGNWAAVETIPRGGNTPLLDPLGGLTFNLDGPDTAALTAPPAPALASAQAAAEMAELYWMMLLRDVHFDSYATNAVALDACNDLSNNFSDYRGPVDSGGNVTPQLLFRVGYPGALDGPIVSQFMLRNFNYDLIPVTPRIMSAVAGEDFMTTFPEWLNVRNGGPVVGGFPPFDPTFRFIRNGRDMGMNAAFDRVYSAYFRAVLILQAIFPFAQVAGVDASFPFPVGSRQGAFTNFGLAHLSEMIGSVGKSERHAWYQKWQVHRRLRPEEYGGLVHRVKVDGAAYPLHDDLMVQSTVLDKVFAANQARNIVRGVGSNGSYLLSQVLRGGSPTHPSYPSGHAITAGACVTVLKAFYNEAALFPGPRKVAADGITTLPYVVGVDGPALTMGGELNKLAHNLSFGRDMSGIHWRTDNTAGNRLGEDLAIRWLHEQKVTYPFPFSGFNLTRFDGTQIVI
ncbi:MAG: hypothetical protein QOH06_5551 [Acidobacteriota bacterium]|nr:hypothetical protein [Acidobacteriota bacterium]